MGPKTFYRCTLGLKDFPGFHSDLRLYPLFSMSLKVLPRLSLEPKVLLRISLDPKIFSQVLTGTVSTLISFFGSQSFLHIFSGAYNIL